MIPRRSGVLGAQADCLSCGWSVHSRNAMGLGAQHAKRTGHEVMCEHTIGVTFNPRNN
jgi:hypothetical protein